MPVLGKRPNVFAAPVAKAYRPTMRDQVANVFSRALGDNYQSNELARGLFGSSGLGGGQGNLLGGLGLLDLTPIGAAFALEEAGRQIGGGQPVTGAANVALGMVPIPAVAKGGKAAVKGLARRVAGKAAKAAPAPKPGFTAYHGSPHTFDQFDTAKIGTGEGAQAYGHGLYFAENEKVAQNYRLINAPTGQGQMEATIANAALERAKKNGLDGQDARRMALEYLAHDAKQVPRPQAYYDAINNFETLTSGQGAPGSMYQVRINADPNDFLDWDRPLSEQPSIVQDMARGADLSHIKPGNRTRRQIEMWRDGTLPNKISEPSGHVLYNALTDYGTDSPSNAALTSKLQDAGIPGIKYLDQGSRGAGEGSRNFVVFDPRIIDIMKRYGVAAPVAAAILAGTMQPPKGKEPGA